MSLYRQILVSFIVFSFFLLSTVFYLNFKHMTSILNNHLVFLLQSNTQFLKDFLEDEEDLKRRIDDMIENPYVNVISYYGKDDVLIYSKQLDNYQSPTPRWFTNFMSNAGFFDDLIDTYKDRVTEDISFIYLLNKDFIHQESYLYFTKALFYLAIVSAIFSLLLYIFLSKLLAPLKLVSAQAKKIIAKDFEIVEKLPNTQDTREILLAMNELTKRSQELFEKQEELILKNKNLLYKDEETSLKNRKSFAKYLSEYLNDKKKSRGFCLIICIGGSSSYKRQIGYEKYSSLLIKLSRILQEHKDENSILARLDINDFAYLIPDESLDINALISKLNSEIRRLLKDFHIYEQISFGYVKYEAKLSPNEIMQSLDLELLKEKSSAQDYRKLIFLSLKSSQFILQDMFYKNSKNIDKLELILGSDKMKITSNSYRDLDFSDDLNLIETMLLELDKNPLKNQACVLISKRLICEESLELLGPLLARFKHKLYFECEEEVELNTLQNFASFLRANGQDLGLIYSKTTSTFASKVSSLKPAYVKIKSDLLLDIWGDALELRAKSTLEGLVQDGFELLCIGKALELGTAFATNCAVRITN